MKSILYVGATLMIGASIYGFVDYKNTSHKKEFTGMYEERKKVPVVSGDEEVVEPVVKKEIAATDKKAVKKNQAAKDVTETVTIKPITKDEMISTKEAKEIGKTIIGVDPARDNVVTKKVTKKKRLDSRIFSRAPLRDEEIRLPEPVKAEVKKTESKEQ